MKRGRPADHRTERFQIRATKGQKKAWERLAKTRNMSLGAWANEVIAKAVEVSDCEDEYNGVIELAAAVLGDR